MGAFKSTQKGKFLWAVIGTKQSKLLEATINPKQVELLGAFGSKRSRGFLCPKQFKRDFYKSKIEKLLGALISQETSKGFLDFSQVQNKYSFWEFS